MPETIRWRHVILTTHSTWLHGDPRGFRSRDHRIHSSGDYQNPPPKGEHAGLHRYQLAQSAPPTVLDQTVFEVIGKAVLENLLKQSYAVEAIAVTPTHVHILANVPDELDRLHEMIGWLKRFATRAARQYSRSLASVEIWAEGQTLKFIKDDQHWRATREYILTKQGSDAWTWEKAVR